MDAAEDRRDARLSASPPRPRPVGRRAGPLAWARTSLFGSWASTAVTLALGFLVLRLSAGLVTWGLVDAVWSVPHDAQGRPQTSACQALQGAGACWAMVADKYRFILFGRFPYEAEWRPLLAVLLFAALYIVSAMRRFWRAELALVWAGALAAIGALMWGGFAGMDYVPQDLWGGLPLTLILATFGLACAFPLAVLAALGRRARGLPAIRMLCVLYVELVRGVPLITLLFMSSVMFPLLLPEGVNVDKLLRAQAAIVLFAAAYIAEVVRGGLQALPRGQHEAADALGLSYWQKTALVVLPQSLRLVVPPLVNTFIGFFKDTSLVLIIGVFDLMTTDRVAVGDAAWQAYADEGYAFAAAIYFAFCFAMSRYSRRLEAERGGAA